MAEILDFNNVFEKASDRENTISFGDVFEAIAPPRVRRSEGAANILESNILSSPDSIDFLEANLSGIPATVDAMNDAKSGWSKFFMALTIPEQQVARNVVLGLETLNQMSKSEAKDLLSRTQLHGSDILNFYWKEDSDETTSESVGRLIAGLGIDIFIDPLSWVAAPLVISTRLGRKFLALADNSMIDASKLAQAQRQKIFFIDEVNHILDKDRRFRGAKSNLKNQIRNFKKLGSFSDGNLSFEQLSTALKTSPESQIALKSASKDLLTTKGIFREFADGDRLITMGFKVPFTDLAMEIPIQPFTAFARGGSKTMLNIANSDITAGAASFINKTPILSQGGRLTADLFQNIWTKTGYTQFDERINLTNGGKREFERKMFENAAIQRESIAKFDTPSMRESVTRLIVDELEFGYVGTPDELLRRAGIVDPSAEQLAKVVRTEGDINRLRRVKTLPEVDGLIGEMREQNEAMLLLYEQRGIPVARLNPLNKGNVRGYLKHMVTEDYLKMVKEGAEAEDEVLEFLQQSFPSRVDFSSLKRKFEGGLREANIESLEKKGVKIFVDDPVELHARRMIEMDTVTRNWDLLDEAANVASISKTHPGLGWVELDMQTMEDKFTLFAKSFETGRPQTVAKKFFPPFYQNLKKGEKVYMPASVHDRVTQQLLSTVDRNAANALMSSFNLANKVFYNNALFGPGYLGLNASSNLVTMLTAGVSNPAKRILQAHRLLLNPKGAKNITIKDAATGAMVDFTPEQIFNEGVKRDLWGNGITNLEWIDAAENMAGIHELQNRGALPLLKIFAKGIQEAGGEAVEVVQDLITEASGKRTNVTSKFGNLVDYGMMWRMNRFVAQYTDDVSKMAVFVDRLDKGYSLASAAESAERYFYNYRNISSRLRGVNRVAPFTTFPVKTMELALEELKDLNLKAFTVPAAVKRTIEGAYVQDFETRQNLERVIPEYILNIDPIHGPLTPGQREVSFEVPWAKMTLNTFLSGDFSVHPVLKAIGATMGAALRNDGGPDEPGEVSAESPFEVGQFIDSLIPPVLATGMGLAEINGFADFGGFFQKKYLPNIPTPGEEARGDSTSIKFNSALEFGKWIEETSGGDFMYRALFPEDIPLTGTLTRDQEKKLVQRGEFIRKHFRQITFGAARLTPLDRGYLINRGSISRRINKQKDAIKRSVMNRTGRIIDPDVLDDPKWIERNKDQHPRLNALQTLKTKKTDLDNYYNMVLQVEQKFPDKDIWGLIFGTNEYGYGFEGFGTASREYEQLLRDQSQDRINEITPETRLEELLVE